MGLFCRRCGKQLYDGTVFCPYCGQQVARATSEAPGNTKLLKADDSVVGTVSKALHSDSENYASLGGFLAFIVYANYAGGALIVIATLLSIVQTTALLSQYSTYGMNGAMLGGTVGVLVLIWILEIAVAGFCIWWAMLIRKRNNSFLLVYHIVGVLMLILAFILVLFTGGALIAIGYVLAGATLLALWTLYFMRSVRVRTYFGTDEYLQRSPFTRPFCAVESKTMD